MSTHVLPRLFRVSAQTMVMAVGLSAVACVFGFLMYVLHIEPWIWESRLTEFDHLYIAKVQKDLPADLPRGSLVERQDGVLLLVGSWDKYDKRFLVYAPHHQYLDPANKRQMYNVVGVVHFDLNNPTYTSLVMKYIAQ